MRCCSALWTVYQATDGPLKAPPSLLVPNYTDTRGPTDILADES